MISFGVSKVDADKALELVGSSGRYQVATTILIYTATFIYGQQFVVMVIVGATPNTTFDNQKNLTTIVTDFNLYKETWVIDLIQSLTMVGVMVGSVLFGQASDVVGRKPVFMCTSVLLAISSFSSGLTQNWETFAVSRFFTGLFAGGAGIAIFVILGELTKKSLWTAIGLTYQACFSLGIVFLAGISLALQNWRIICMVTSGLGVLIMIPIFILIPESPKWLYAMGRTQKAEEVFRKIAKWNGKGEINLSLTPVANEIEGKTHTFVDMFCYKKLATWILSMAFVWFTSSLLYYGLTMSAADLSPDLYLGVALSGAVEIPAILSCIFLMDFKWLGRRGTCLLLLLVCCAISITTVFVPESSAIALLVLGLISKLHIAGIFAVLYVYTTEVFPTPLRSVALGTSSTVARVGSIAGAFVPLLFQSLPILPYILFGVATFFAALLTLLLPETLGKPLPQTIDEVVDPTYQPLIYSDDVDESEEQRYGFPANA